MSKIIIFILIIGLTYIIWENRGEDCNGNTPTVRISKQVDKEGKITFKWSTLQQHSTPACNTSSFLKKLKDNLQTKIHAGLSAIHFKDGSNNFTGLFVADSRPHEILFLGLTQSENSVSGSLITVKPDKSGSTRSNNLLVQGTIDNNAITLTSNGFFGDIVINGKKQGDSVVLMFPTNSGQISNVDFMPTTEYEYNLLLSSWQDDLAFIHRESMLAKAKKERLTNLASNFKDAINEIKNTKINKNNVDLKSALKAEQSALEYLENDLIELKKDASLRPMTCFQLNSKISYDYKFNMSYSYDTRLGYARDHFTSVLTDLEKSLSLVEAIVMQTNRKSHELSQAIEDIGDPFKLKTMPGDERDVLGQFQAIAASTRNELPLIKSNHSNILKKAKKIMTEGEIILKTAQASIKCN